MKWKAVTPNYLVAEDWNISIEKVADGEHFIVVIRNGSVTKERLFGQESEADSFISYLTDNNL